MGSSFPDVLRGNRGFTPIVAAAGDSPPSAVGAPPAEAADEHLTGAVMAAALSRALGRAVRHNAVTPAALRSPGFPGTEDLGNMFKFKHDFEADFCAARDPEQARALNPELETFERWLERQREPDPARVGIPGARRRSPRREPDLARSE